MVAPVSFFPPSLAMRSAEVFSLSFAPGCGASGRSPACPAAAAASPVTLGWPPLRGPLLQMATRGLTVPDQHRVVADVQAVVRHLVDVDRADLVASG